MCLVVKSGPHVAKKDIPVFKLIGKNNRSAYQGFQYSPHETTHQRNLYPGFEGVITHGFHAYRYGIVYFERIDDPHNNRGWLGRMDIASGAFLSREHASLGEKGVEKLAAFTIPKGATYYLGKDGDIVTSQIRAGSLKEMRSRDLKRKRKVKV